MLISLKFNRRDLARVMWALSQRIDVIDDTECGSPETAAELHNEREALQAVLTGIKEAIDEAEVK